MDDAQEKSVIHALLERVVSIIEKGQPVVEALFQNSPSAADLKVILEQYDYKAMQVSQSVIWFKKKEHHTLAERSKNEASEMESQKSQSPEYKDGYEGDCHRHSNDAASCTKKKSTPETKVHTLAETALNPYFGHWTQNMPDWDFTENSTQESITTVPSLYRDTGYADDGNSTADEYVTDQFEIQHMPTCYDMEWQQRVQQVEDMQEEIRRKATTIAEIMANWKAMKLGSAAQDDGSYEGFE